MKPPGTAITLLLGMMITSIHADTPFDRQANSTLNLPQNPQGQLVTYSITEAMGGLAFDRPVNFAGEPGETNRLFVVERTGKIIVITNLASPTRTVFLDITARVQSDYDFGFREGLSSMAFHPGYATNDYFYITYTARTNVSGIWQDYNRLARYQRSATDRNQGLPNSELILINQFDEGAGHNLNDLHFGADGYLYCAVGDEGDGGTGGDEYDNAQRIDKDFFSAILRIDVDKRPGSLTPNSHPAATAHYAIPPDNPFVGATSFNGSPVNPANIRTEFYAVGFRNVWRMSFDPGTGFLYAGDVGQWDREEINVVTKGGNYGWAYREGSLVGPKGDPPPGVDLIPPIAEIVHGWGNNEGFAVMGGVVYRGHRIPGLTGAYIFSDYVTGNLWMLRYDGVSATPFERIGYVGNVAGFGVDPRNGDVLLADHGSGSIRKLDYTPVSSGNLPQTLMDTGAFSDLATLTPHTGIVAYELNVPFWSDNAKKWRWFSVPDPALKMTFNRDGNWSFPAGTVWIKHFELELTNGVPQSARRLETRFLVRNPSGVYGVTYRWGTSTSNAMVVPEEGMDETFLINDGGTIRTQIWHYPGRNECLSCHTAVGGHALGFNTPQLNRNFDYGAVTNQIHALSAAGYFESPVTNLHLLGALAHATNSAHSREYRVRSYLAANCAQCHQPGGPASGNWDARITTPLSEANIVNGLLMNNLGDSNNRVVAPGSLGYSALLTRISNSASLRMPPIATRLLNTEAINLVRDWIANDLAGYRSLWTWQMDYFDSTTSSEAVSDADPDRDGNSNYMEYLLGGNPLNPGDGWRPTLELSNDLACISFLQVSNRGFEVQAATNLQPTISWTPLDHPDNRPFFSASNRINIITEPVTNSPIKYYRVRVFEP